MAFVYTSNPFWIRSQYKELQTPRGEENTMDDYLDELLASNEEEQFFYEIEEPLEHDDAMEL